jgi:hypothetical protein
MTSIYRENHSFYLSDGPRPTFIHFTAGSGRDVRAEYFARIDRHGALFPPSGAIQEVRKRYGREPVPIYVTERGSRTPAYLLELANTLVWIRFNEMPSDEFALLAARLTEAVAYWFWQICKADTQLLDRIGSGRPFLMIDLAVTDEDAWLTAATEVTQAGPIVQVNPTETGLSVEFSIAIPRPSAGR